MMWMATVAILMLWAFLVGRSWERMRERFRHTFRTYVVRFDDGITVRVVARNAMQAGLKAKRKWAFPISEVYPEPDEDEG